MRSRSRIHFSRSVGKARLSASRWPIQCHPIHHLRENEMVLSVAHLPNACVRTLPILANPIEAAPHSDPHVVRNRTDVFVVQIERVHELTVNIGLELRSGSIADADRSRTAISLPVIQVLFR